MPRAHAIRAERDGAVLTLTLDYPARRNALAMPLRIAMADALERARRATAPCAPSC